jgi:hypothetical protein
VDLEQERRPSVHPATDLKGCDRTVSDTAIDDELVGHGLDRQLAGFLDRDTVAVASCGCGGAISTVWPPSRMVMRCCPG